MGSHGSPGARFERALRTDNPLLVKAAAAEMRPLTLPHALRYLVFIAEHAPKDFEPAARRWHERWVTETRASAEEGALALSALMTLPGPSSEAGLAALSELAALHQQHELLCVLDGMEGVGSPSA